MMCLFSVKINAQFRYRIQLPDNGTWVIAGSPNGTYFVDVRNPNTNATITFQTVPSSGYTLNLAAAANQEVDIVVVDVSEIFVQFYWHSSNDRTRLKQIVNWGGRWLSMEGAFEGCTNLQITAPSKPDVSQVTNFSKMFKGCSSITTFPDLGNWNLPNATDLSEMFSGCTNFNADLFNWDIRTVTNFSNMFNGCAAFNGQISGTTGLNPLVAINMSGMFRGCTNFNQNISNWNVSNVQNMNSMFEGARSFNQAIGN